MIGTSRVKRRTVKASYRQLEEQLLYHKGLGGSYDITISDYWDKVVCNHKPIYSNYAFSKGNSRVVCPFHEDLKPSLGIVKDGETGIEIFNCFGCGVKGTIIGFHKLFSERYLGEHFTNGYGYLNSLAKLYGVQLSNTIEEVQEEKSKFDFSKAPPYTVSIHRENVETLKERYNQGSLSLQGLKEQLTLITNKVLEVKSAKKSTEGSSA